MTTYSLIFQQEIKHSKNITSGAKFSAILTKVEVFEDFRFFLFLSKKGSKVACYNFGFSYYADRSNQNRGVTAPLAATLFVLANKKDAKNGLLIARNVRLFQERVARWSLLVRQGWSAEHLCTEHGRCWS